MWGVSPSWSTDERPQVRGVIGQASDVQPLSGGDQWNGPIQITGAVDRSSSHQMTVFEMKGDEAPVFRFSAHDNFVSFDVKSSVLDVDVVLV